MARREANQRFRRKSKKYDILLSLDSEGLARPAPATPRFFMFARDGVTQYLFFHISAAVS